MENNTPDFVGDVPPIIPPELQFMHEGAPAFSVSLSAGT
jgi:hypothetical protein